MRVLFVGCYRDRSGWAQNAINQILALDAAGVDVVVRCVKFTSTPPGEIPARILELEQKSAVGCDVVVQNVLPQFMERVGDARNIAYYFGETNILPNGWGRHLALMDESWVPNQGAVSAERWAFGDARKVTVVPCATDVSRFQQSYKSHKIREEFPDHFFFYTIGEGRRKNLPALVQAFHLAFEPHEPVELIIKTSLPGASPADARRVIEQDFAKIKEHMGLYPAAGHYKREIVMTDHLSEHELMRLHATGDCFVSASHGEGWNIGLFDAMAMGKTPIYTGVSGHQAFLDPTRGYAAMGSRGPVMGLNDGIYDARHEWFNVDVLHLAELMRHVYTHRDSDVRKAKRKAGVAHAFEFSYRKVGDLMRTNLEQGVGDA